MTPNHLQRGHRGPGTTNVLGVVGPDIPTALSIVSAGSAGPWRASVVAGALEAVVELPGSKSLSTQALLLTTITDTPMMPTGLPHSCDTELMFAAPSMFGARLEDLDETGTRLRVTPASLPLHVQTRSDGAGHIGAGSAGTVTRFVPALVALTDALVVFDGGEAVRHRPTAPLFGVLAALDAEVTHPGEPGLLSLRVDPSDDALLRTEGVRAVVDGLAPSQFVSAPLLLGVILPGGPELTPTGSVPPLMYVGMTIAALRERGITVDEPAPGTGDGERIWRTHFDCPCGGEAAIKSNLFNAGPFLAAVLMTGGRVNVLHRLVAMTQVDNVWRVLLLRLGGEMILTGGPLTVHSIGQLTGIHANLPDVGELAPTMAVLIALIGTQGHTSILTDITHPRGHETDRLAILTIQIRPLGGDAEESGDGLTIRLASLHGAALRSHVDHRTAIFVAIIGLSMGGVNLDDIECTSKTLLGFTDLWATMFAATGEGGSGLVTAPHREPAAPGDGA